MLASNTQVLAIFAVADTIKESSRRFIAELHGLGVTSVMLTGDNVATAKAIAKQAGIDDARGNLVARGQTRGDCGKMQKQYGYVAMTGDAGINDAPASCPR